LVEKDTIDHTDNQVTKPVFYNKPLTEKDSNDSFWDNFKVSAKGATDLGEELTKFYDWHHDETHWEPIELGEELEDKESTNLNDGIKELYKDYDHVEPTSTPTLTSIPIVLIGKEPCPLNKHLVHTFPEEKDESITLLVDGPTKSVPAPTYCTTKASLDGILELKSILRKATDWRTRRTNDTIVDLRAVWSDDRDSPWSPPSKVWITPTTVKMDSARTAMERPSPTPIILVVEPPTPIAPSTKTAVGNQDRDQKKPLFLKSQQQGNQDSGKICSNTILKGNHSTNATRLVINEELVKDCPLLGRTVIHDLHMESNAGLRDILNIISMELEKVKQTRNNGPVVSNLPSTETTDHEMSVLVGQGVITHSHTTMRVMQPGVSDQVSIGITKRSAEAPTKRKLSSPTEFPGLFKDRKILKSNNGNQGPVDMVTLEAAHIKETSFPIIKGIMGVPGPVLSGLLVRDLCHHPRLPRDGQVHGQHVKVPEQGPKPKMGSKLGITTRVATISTHLVSKVTAPRLRTEPNVTHVKHPDDKAGRNGPITGSIPETSLVQCHSVARASDLPGAMINMRPDSVRKQACDQMECQRFNSHCVELEEGVKREKPQNFVVMYPIIFFINKMIPESKDEETPNKSAGPKVALASIKGDVPIEANVPVLLSESSLQYPLADHCNHVGSHQHRQRGRPEAIPNFQLWSQRDKVITLAVKVSVHEWQVYKFLQGITVIRWTFQLTRAVATILAMCFLKVPKEKAVRFRRHPVSRPPPHAETPGQHHSRTCPHYRPISTNHGRTAHFGQSSPNLRPTSELPEHLTCHTTREHPSSHSWQ
jgi:hypothetical protein